MKTLQEQSAPPKRITKHLNLCKKSAPLSEILYCIEEIQNSHKTNAIQLLIRNIVTGETYIKHPLSLYFEKSLLNCFSPEDIRIIMTYVIFKLNKELPKPLKLEGYDYSQENKLNIYYDMRLKKIIKSFEYIA